MILIFRADRFTGATDTTAQASAFRSSLLIQPPAQWRANPAAGERDLAAAFDRMFAGGSDPAVWPAVSAGARDAHAALIGNYLGTRDRNSWIHFADIGQWGDNVLNRASITEFIQFGNGISTAAYYHAFRDGGGAPLDGNRPGGYTLTFPASAIPEASRFWSLTAYTPNSIELIPNPAGKYVVAGPAEQSRQPTIAHDCKLERVPLLCRRVSQSRACTSV